MPESIHGACEDYRAAATIDLEHDKDHDVKKVACPIHVVWGEHGIIGRMFHPLQDWQEKCDAAVTGMAVAAGHFIPEQAPEVLLAEMKKFLVDE
jgi:haloacetate dehalogenase